MSIMKRGPGGVRGKLGGVTGVPADFTSNSQPAVMLRLPVRPVKTPKHPQLMLSNQLVELVFQLKTHF